MSVGPCCEVIRVNVVRFERFIKDNDVKRQRALKKEKDELTARPYDIVPFPAQLTQLGEMA